MKALFLDRALAKSRIKQLFKDLAIVLSLCLVLYALHDSQLSLFISLRFIASSLFLLFFLGYFTIRPLKKTIDLDWQDQVLLSIGLNVFIVSVILLALSTVLSSIISFSFFTLLSAVIVVIIIIIFITDLLVGENPVFDIKSFAQKKLTSYESRRALIFLIPVAVLIIIFVLPAVVNEKPIGEDTYVYTAISQSILNGNPPWIHPFFHPYGCEKAWLYPVFTAAFSVLSGVPAFRIHTIIPAFYTLFLYVVLYRITKSLTGKTLAGILAGFSGVFMYNEVVRWFYMSKPYVFAIPFLLLSLHFYHLALKNNKKIIGLFSAILFGTASMSYELTALLGTWIFLSPVIFQLIKRNKKEFFRVIKYSAISLSGVLVALPYYLQLLNMMSSQPRSIWQISSQNYPKPMQQGFLLPLSPGWDILYPILWDFLGDYAYPFPFPFLPDLYPEYRSFYSVFKSLLPLGLLPLFGFGILGLLVLLKSKCADATSKKLFGLWFIGLYIWPLYPYVSYAFFWFVVANVPFLGSISGHLRYLVGFPVREISYFAIYSSVFFGIAFAYLLDQSKEFCLKMFSADRNRSKLIFNVTNSLRKKHVLFHSNRVRGMLCLSLLVLATFFISFSIVKWSFVTYLNLNHPEVLSDGERRLTEWINQHTDPETLICAPTSIQKFVISPFTGRPGIFMIGAGTGVYGMNETEGQEKTDIYTLIYGRSDPQGAVSLLRKYSVRYVISYRELNDAMKSGFDDPFSESDQLKSLWKISHIEAGGIGVSVSDGLAKLSGYACLYTIKTFSYGSVSWYAKIDSLNAAIGFDAYNSNNFVRWYNGNFEVGVDKSEGEPILFQVPAMVEMGSYHNYTIVWQKSYASFLIDGQLKAEIRDLTPSMNLPIFAYVPPSQKLTIDWVKVSQTFPIYRPILEVGTIHIVQFADPVYRKYAEFHNVTLFEVNTDT